MSLFRQYIWLFFSSIEFVLLIGNFCLPVMYPWHNSSLASMLHFLLHRGSSYTCLTIHTCLCSLMWPRWSEARFRNLGIRTLMRSHYNPFRILLVGKRKIICPRFESKLIFKLDWQCSKLEFVNGCLYLACLILNSMLIQVIWSKPYELGSNLEGFLGQYSVLLCYNSFCGYGFAPMLFVTLEQLEDFQACTLAALISSLLFHASICSYQFNSLASFFLFFSWQPQFHAPFSSCSFYYFVWGWLGILKVLSC